MKLNGKPRCSILEKGKAIEILDQRKLPHAVKLVKISTMQKAARAISEMWVRGAPLIGATGAYGLVFALRKNASDAALNAAYKTLLATRPTAVNLRWALDSMLQTVKKLPPEKRAEAALKRAREICSEDITTCEAIGNHGLALIQKLYARKKRTLNILTHCNTGWIACVDWGTALACFYKAHDAGIPIHIWVDETRPRNQGALTAWELAQHGVPHTVIVDNAGGQLMREGKVDLCIVGADRVTANGDVCNKIGTYLKALAAKDNDVPFYVALPHTTIDKHTKSGDDVEIEERNPEEVLKIGGVALYPKNTRAANPAFDVTPARLITGYITESGVTPAAGFKSKILKNL